MDYEKKYNDALDIARKMHDLPNSSEKTRELFEAMFPELSVSEDERMLREIMQYIKEQGNKPTGLPNGSVCVADMLIWLEEKQKEQKPSSRKRNKPKESWFSKAKYETEHADELLAKKQEELREIRELKNKEQKPSTPEDIAAAYQLGLADVRKEQKPMEWKPQPESLEALMYAIEGKWEKIRPTSYLSRRLEDLYDGLVNTFNVDEPLLYELPNVAATEDIEELRELKCKIDASMEQKPAKKQDYSGLSDLEGAIHRGFLCAGVENVPVTIIKETAKDCLVQMKPAEWSDTKELVFKDICKHLKEEGYNGWVEVLNALRNGEFKQPVAEWSEEDEQMRLTCIDIIEHFPIPSGAVVYGPWNDCIDWLKSLRSRPKPSDNWKPSEEQMEALHTVAYIKEIDYYGGLKDRLRELYEQLKRL